MRTEINMPTAEEAWQILLEGNQRYIANKAQHPHASAADRDELVQEQHPFAVVLGCSDSRVPPTLIFDQGLGDLFVIRVAGNILSESVVASIEYAVAYLHTPLVVVLGHSGCGAVTAALSHQILAGHIGHLVTEIRIGLGGVDPLEMEDVDTAVRLNTRSVAQQLALSQPILAPRVADKSLKIVPTVYELDSGLVHLVP